MAGFMPSCSSISLPSVVKFSSERDFEYETPFAASVICTLIDLLNKRPRSAASRRVSIGWSRTLNTPCSRCR